MISDDQKREEQNSERPLEKWGQHERELAGLYITSAELKELGYTRAQISRLGEPDLTKPLRQGLVRHYWLRARVGPPPPQRAAVKAATRVDLLAAIFAVNQAAGRAQEKKEELYALKDRGIARAYREGRLGYQGRHGGLAIYRGEGYCFHSTLEPEDALPPETGRVETAVFVEAKPRGVKEARLIDARLTLEQIDASIMHEFEVLEAPRRTKQGALPDDERSPYWDDDGAMTRTRRTISNGQDDDRRIVAAQETLEP